MIVAVWKDILHTVWGTVVRQCLDGYKHGSAHMRWKKGTKSLYMSIILHMLSHLT